MKTYTLNEIAMLCPDSPLVSSVKRFLTKLQFVCIGTTSAGEPLYNARTKDAVVEHFERVSKLHAAPAADCLGVTQLAAQLSLTRQTVRRRISNLRMKPCAYAERSNNRVALYSPDQRDLIGRCSAARHARINLERRKAGETTAREIAADCGVSTFRVCAVIGILHIKPVGRYVRDSASDEINTYSRKDAERVKAKIRGSVK